MSGVAPNARFRDLAPPPRPNHWLVAPHGFVPQPDAPAPVFEVSADALERAFLRVALASGRATVFERSERFVHLVDATPVLRFKDDIYVQFIALTPRQATLAAYSASRTGYWDLGTNRRRLERWMAALRACL